MVGVAKAIVVVVIVTFVGAHVWAGATLLPASHIGGASATYGD